jgi:hypothetical protein
MKNSLTFQEVVELEGTVPGMYYRRCDYPAKWCFYFENGTGLLMQYYDGGEPTSRGDWYHHDFMDGVFKVSKPVSTKA